jgi:hypothetical protein
MPPPANYVSGYTRKSRLLAVVELAVIVGIFVGERYLPVSKTPYLFVLGWVSLRFRGLGWKDVGLGAAPQLANGNRHRRACWRGYGDTGVVRQPAGADQTRRPQA